MERKGVDTIWLSRDTNGHHSLTNVDTMMDKSFVDSGNEVSVKGESVIAARPPRGKPIKSAKKNASDKDSNISLSKTLDKSSALEGNIASPDHASLSRCFRLHKEVVGSDG